MRMCLLGQAFGQAVFDRGTGRGTGPYARRAVLGMPGAGELDEEM